MTDDAEELFAEFAAAHAGEPLPDRGPTFVEVHDPEAVAAVEEVIARARRDELSDPGNAAIEPVGRDELGVDDAG